MTINCPHPRPKLNLPGWTPPRFAWQPPAYLPTGSLADLSRALTEQFRGVYAVLQQLGQRRTVVPLVEDIDAREGQVIVGVADGQVIRLPLGSEGGLGQVGVVLTDVINPVTIVNPDGTTQSLGTAGAYDFLSGSPEVYQTNPGGTVLGGSIPTDRLIGRDSPGTGAFETIALTSPLEFTGAQAIRIADNGITDELFRESAEFSVIGRASSGTGNVADIPVSENSVLGRAGAAGTGDIEAITVPDTGTLTGEVVFLQSSSLRNHVRWSNFGLNALPLMNDNRLIANVSGAQARPAYVDFAAIADGSQGVSFDGTNHVFVTKTFETLFVSDDGNVERSEITGDVSIPEFSNSATIQPNVVDNTKLADMAESTVKGRAAGAGTGDPQDLSTTQLSALVTKTWDEILAAGNNSGTNNPHIDSGQFIGFGAEGSLPSSGQIRSSASFTINATGVLGLTGSLLATLQSGSSGTTTTFTAAGGAGAGAIISTGGTERLEIETTGAWQLGGSVGSSGQVLKSNGAGTPPTWQDDDDTTYSAGDGLSLTGTEFSWDGIVTWQDGSPQLTATVYGLSDSTSILADGFVSGTDGGGVPFGWDFRFQRAALTGAIEADQDSNDTVFGASAAGAGLTGGGTATLAVAIPLTDGDKGDVSVASDGTVWTINDGAVSNSKMRQSSAFSVIGRAGSTTGNVSDITATAAGQILKLNNAGTSLLFGQAATASIEDNAVTNGKLRDSAALSVIGRSANSTGDPADIAASSDGQVLRRSGTTLGFGTVATAGIADDAVTNAKLAEMAANTIKANATAGSANPTDLAISGDSFPARVGSNLTSHSFDTLAGEHLDYSAGVMTWRKSRSVCVWWEDFECVNPTSLTGPHHFGNSVWITTALSASGSVAFLAGEQDHPGVCRIQTDAVDNSVYSVHRGGPDANSTWVSGDSIREFEAIVRSNLTQTKAFMIGFNSNTADVTTSGPSNIVAFMFDSDNASLDTNIQCVVKEASSGGTPTITDSGVSLNSVHGSWISLRIRQTTLGTVEFLIDDDVVATMSSRVPDDEIMNCGITVVTRAASATAIDVDYVYFESQPLSRF